MAKGKELLRAEFDDAAKYYAASAAFGCAVSIVGVVALPIVVPLVWLAKSIEYKRIECVLHARALKVKRGWLNKTEQTIPLDKITDVAVRQTLVMRWIGVDAISVETAGQTNMGGAVVHLVGVRDARTFRDEVLDQRDRVVYREEEPETAGTQRGPSGDAESVLGEIRDVLVRIEKKMPGTERQQ